MTDSKMYNFMKPDEKVNPMTMLERMGELDKCLITGDTKDLVCIPVDGDMNNILPTNMIRVTNNIATEIGVHYVKSRQWGPWELILDAFHEVHQHNEKVLNELDPLVVDEYADPGVGFVKVFEHICANHIKGLFEVKRDGISVNRGQYQSYMLRQLLKHAKPQSSIVHPSSNLGIVR